MYHCLNYYIFDYHTHGCEYARRHRDLFMATAPIALLSAAVASLQTDVSAIFIDAAKRRYGNAKMLPFGAVRYQEQRFAK